MERPDHLDKSRCSIGKLPLELLTEILKLSTGCKAWGELPEQHFSNPRLVCKRWRQAYEPAFYQTLNLHDTIPGGQIRSIWHINRRLSSERSPHYTLINWLQEKFSQNPQLGRYVREMYVAVSRNGHAGTYGQVLKIMSLCPELKSLDIQGPEGDGLQAIVKAAGQLSRLSAFGLEVVAGSVSLMTIVNSFKPCVLKKLRLKIVGMQEDHTLSLSIPKGSAPIKNLHLSQPLIPPAIARLLVGWSSGLEVITIDGLGGGADAYTASDLQQILDTHSPSLRSITMGDYGSSGAFGDIRKRNRSMLDFSQYPHLRRISLCKENIFREDPSTAAVKLSAPELTHFHISLLDHNHAITSSIEAFEERELEWVLEFASMKSSQGLLANLHTIEVEHTIRNVEKDDSEDLEWPWKHIEMASESIREFGVSLAYEPSISEEEWKERLRNIEEEERECITSDSDLEDSDSMGSSRDEHRELIQGRIVTFQV